MSKTVKNLLLFFILLCLIVLIVFVVELYLVNRDVEPDPGLTSVDTSPPDSSGTPSQSTPAGVSTSPGESETPSGETTPVQTADGTLFEIPISGGETLTLIADEEQFEHQMLDMLGNMFIYKSPLGEPATLEISIIEGKEAIVIAPDFLNDYIDYIGGEFNSEGESRIADSGLYGELVIASKDGQTYEAWLVDVDGGVLAIVINYWSDGQKAALYRVLDTLEMIAS